MTAATLARLAVQVAMFLLVGASVRRLLLDRLLRARAYDFIAGLPERGLLTLFAAVLFSLGGMVLHLLSGGAVFGVPFVIPFLAGVVIVCAIRSTARETLPIQPHAAIVMLALVLAALYVLPVVLGGTSVRIGDPAWHLGWSEQLLAGDAVPTGPAPHAVARNSYPWGFHAVVATLVRLVPGTEPLAALDALHVLLVLALPLAAACLARRLDRSSGIAAAAAMTLVGGWGWLSARSPAFIGSPTDGRYGADLVVASPNAVYELLPPAFPRELALVLLALSAMLLMRACRASDRDPQPATRLALLAGVAAGCVGLLNVPLFVSALLWLVLGALWARAPARAVLLPAVGVAVAVFAFWAAPVLSDYIRFGGFVNITPRLGKEWPLLTALGSWGLLLPAAAAGIAVVWRRGSATNPIYGMAIATASLLALSITRSAYAWDLHGNATVLHQGRVWPVAHLLGAVFAGVGLAPASRWLSRESRLRVLATALFLLLAGASPVLASIALTQTIERQEGGYVYGAAYQRPGAFVWEAAAALGPDDVVSVQQSKEIAFLLFQFSGTRLACYDDPHLARNDLRIRFAGLARDWDDRVRSTGFPATHQVVPIAEAQDDVVVSGVYKGRQWALVEAPRSARECPEAQQG